MKIISKEEYSIISGEPEPNYTSRYELVKTSKETKTLAASASGRIINRNVTFCVFTGEETFGIPIDRPIYFPARRIEELKEIATNHLEYILENLVVKS